MELSLYQEVIGRLVDYATLGGTGRVTKGGIVGKTETHSLGSTKEEGPKFGFSLEMQRSFRASQNGGFHVMSSCK